MTTRRIIPHAPGAAFENIVLYDGEIVKNETTDQLHLGDGVTLGGNSVPTTAALASTDPVNPGAARVGLPTGRDVADKVADIVNTKDADPLAGLNDNHDALPFLQMQINMLKGSNTLAVANTSIRYGSKCLNLKPGIYTISGPLVVDGDITLHCDAWGGAIIRYLGTGSAIVVNSTNIGPYASASQNVRTATLSGVSIYAPNAEHGVLIGSATQRHITIERGSIWGPKWGVYCGEAVYFLALKNMDIRGCDIGAYAGAYCDLFTVIDRTLFNGNRVCDLDLECPTYFIQNNDFEGGQGAIAAIRIKHLNVAVAELRAGLLFANRFGPELSAPGTTTYLNDILITDNGAAGAMDGIKIENNSFLSYTDARQKQSPVRIEGKVKRLSIRGNKMAGYPGSFITGDPAKAFASGTSIPDNFIDDIFSVADDMKGLFTRCLNKSVRPAIAASGAVVAGGVLRYASHTTVAGFAAASVAPLPSSGSSTNYKMYAGVALHASVASRVVWIADPDYVLTTDIDSTGATIGDPVYLQASGGLGLASASVAFRIGRLLTVGVAAKVVIRPQDQGAG